MRSSRRLLFITAALAASLALPTAAVADPVCVSVGYSVLGSGSDHGSCVPTGFSTIGISAEPGNADLAQLRVSADVPTPLFLQVPTR